MVYAFKTRRNETKTSDKNTIQYYLLFFTHLPSTAQTVRPKGTKTFFFIASLLSFFFFYRNSESTFNKFSSHVAPVYFFFRHRFVPRMLKTYAQHRSSKIHTSHATGTKDENIISTSW